MEHSLLVPHNLSLKEGIPYRLINHLSKGDRFCDANLDYSSASDDDLKVINEMENSLGVLSPALKDLRVVADFCCIWRYDYPQRVYDICSILGGNTHTELRLHYQICPDRRQYFIDYAEALKGWIKGIEPDDKTYFRSGAEETVRKVYDLLGSKNFLKSILAERTYLGLSSRFLNCTFWGCINKGGEVSLLPNTAQQLSGDWRARMSELEHNIRKEMGNKAHDFLCDVGGSAEPACHFKFIRRVDILVSSIGCLRWRGNLPAKDGNIKGRRQITKIYLSVLEKYWNSNKSLTVVDGGQEIEAELFNLLGEPDDFKRWLVACLWKNIKNQTMYQAYPMRRWVEFVRIGEDYIRGLETQS
jgi:hypothetical protein